MVRTYKPHFARQRRGMDSDTPTASVPAPATMLPRCAGRRSLRTRPPRPGQPRPRTVTSGCTGVNRTRTAPRRSRPRAGVRIGAYLRDRGCGVPERFRGQPVSRECSSPRVFLSQKVSDHMSSKPAPGAPPQATGASHSSHACRVVHMRAADRTPSNAPWQPIPTQTDFCGTPPRFPPSGPPVEFIRIFDITVARVERRSCPLMESGTTSLVHKCNWRWTRKGPSVDGT